MFLVLLAAAAIAAAALCTVWTVRQLERLAEEHRLSRADDLTGLPNRHAFIEALEEATASRRGTPRSSASPSRSPARSTCGSSPRASSAR
jgi:GGDEF domain-containing protein